MEWEMISAFAAMLAMFATWATIFEKKKAKRIKKYNEERQKEKEVDKLKDRVMFSEFKDELITSFDEMFDKKLESYLKIDLFEMNNNKLWHKLNSISDELKTHFNDTVEAEIDRLGHEIMNYADALRSGETRYRDSFKYISQQYDKYKRLGGNNYIDQQYAYIKEKMKDVVD